MTFHRSSYCTASGCVEVDIAQDSVTVRESTDGPTLVFTRYEWATFIQGVKAGQFDPPTRTT